MQFQADLLQTNVVRPRITETTALGAAYLAGLATGYWSGIDEIRQQWQIDRQFSPLMGPGERSVLLEGWKRAVRATLEWGENSQPPGRSTISPGSPHG
jgi:glycerol kinase